MKKSKILIIIGIMLLLAIPIFSWAQTVPDEYKKAVDWMQGGNILEDWFMKKFLSEWKAKMFAEYDTFIGMAQALGASFAIIFFAIKSYEMMTGDKKVEILPLLRPFMLCMIIVNWGTFVTVVSVPTNLIAQITAAKLDAQQAKVNNLRYVRAEYQFRFVEALYKKSSETKVAADQSTSFWDDPLGNMGTAIKDQAKDLVIDIVSMKEKFEIGLNLAITQALELISLWLLRVAVYALFSIQIIYGTILIMLGPFSASISILPMFRDSLSTWIARFISVNLYVGIAFIVLFVGSLLQEFAMTAEIDRYKEVLSQSGQVLNESAFTYLKTNGIMSFGIVIVSFLISAVTMFTVPTISTWIVSTSGAGSAVSTMGRGASKVSSAIKMASGKIF